MNPKFIILKEQNTGKNWKKDKTEYNEVKEGGKLKQLDSYFKDNCTKLKVKVKVDKNQYRTAKKRYEWLKRWYVKGQ